MIHELEICRGNIKVIKITQWYFAQLVCTISKREKQIDYLSWIIIHSYREKQIEIVYIGFYSIYSIFWPFFISVIILRFIYVVACINNLFLLLNSILLYGYTKICSFIHLYQYDIWFVSSLRLQIDLLWTFMYKSLYGHMLRFLFVG